MLADVDRKFSDYGRRNVGNFVGMRPDFDKGNFWVFKVEFSLQLPTIFQWISADCQWVTGLKRKKIPGG